MKQLPLIMIVIFTISVQHLYSRTFSDQNVKLEGNELYQKALAEQRMKNTGDSSAGKAASTDNVTWLVKPELDECPSNVFSEDRMAVKKNGMWGYIDKQVKFIIEPQFSGAESFSDGRAAVMKDGKWGYINKQGKFIIEPQFDEAGSFSDGRAAVMKDGKWGYINKQGKFKLDEIPPLDKLMAGINTKKGQLGLKGEIAAKILSKESEQRGSQDELIAFQEYNKWGFKNKQGKIVIEPRFYLAQDFHEGLAAVELEHLSRWGYINKQGKFVIEPQFITADSFSEGLASFFAENLKHGYINKQGAIVIEPVFDYACQFSEGLACVKKGWDWGFINKQGEFVIEPQFSHLAFFKNGMAAIKWNGKWGLILNPLTAKAVKEGKPAKKKL